jgi:UDP-N-acetylglucosamine acyltransferase
LREGVTMNTGTEDGGGVTRIGDRCSFMVGSHIGHDCTVGNDVTFANNVVLGGHVGVGDHTFLGGHVAIHQFVRIGEGVMMAGMSAARDDIIPFGFALGQTGALVGLNIVGLRRRGATKAEMHRLRRAYRSLFFTSGRLAERIEALARDFADDPLVGKIVDFVRAGGKRPLMRPRARRGADAGDGDAEGA